MNQGLLGKSAQLRVALSEAMRRHQVLIVWVEACVHTANLQH